MPCPSKESRTGPVTSFDVPMRPAGAKHDPVDRPAQSLRPAGDGRHREEREPRACRQIEREARRRVEDEIGLPHDDRAHRGPRDERGADGERVVEPRPGHADGEDERSRDMPQALVEIGRILLRDPVEPPLGDEGGASPSESRSPITASGTIPASRQAIAPPSAATTG
jgi:hypothetical protein